ALWSPDFPLAAEAASDHLALSDEPPTVRCTAELTFSSAFRLRWVRRLAVGILEQLVPVDDAVARPAELDRIAPLQLIEQLRRDVHVAALAGAVLHRRHREPTPHADRRVLLEHVRPHASRGDLAQLALLGDLRVELGSLLARRLLFAGDVLAECVEVGLV